MRRVLRAVPALALLAASACTASPPPLPPAPAVPEPPADSVESVLFLIGDAGEAIEGMSPPLARLQRDVEAWSCRLGRDSSVAVVFLGDNIYPDGLHPPGHPQRPEDLIRLRSQTSALAGSCSVRRRTAGIFVAGNHDWGTSEGVEGLVRVQNLEAYLSELRRETGVRVNLLPDAGRLGPAVVDIGSRLRLVLLDTAWWLLSPSSADKLWLQGELLKAMTTRGERSVVVAAHHPFNTAGPHSGLRSLWSTIGVKFLLARSGAWLQDLTSQPYTDLRERLRQVFALSGGPLVFAGGHEHSLQHIEGDGPADPRHVLVSGSASKVTNVGNTRGMRMGYAGPGYMRLVAWKNGRVDLFVIAAPERFQHCRPEGVVPVPECMEAGIAAHRIIYSARLQ